ncbi:histidine kinase N-terminal domain-containing protein [Bacillus sp. DJP31]|uniref:histidine kinase N-terminal domain-containing protein n=1 Tax=Bacillus sp. DJP31 TaxID=3409789 RepID=UPI003BB68262
MTVEEKLCHYLENSYGDFLGKWSNSVLISNDDPYKDEVINNGKRMIQLVIHFLRNDSDMSLLKNLAYKVAAERIQANVNIGDFIYNVNIGRSEIFKHLNHSQVAIEELQPTINKINHSFDQFIYFAVQKYTGIKDQDIEAKKSFIEHTHKDRLTLLGQMASSFVHEFRNPLTSITGFIKLLQRENPTLNYLDVISHELEQLNYQISQFLLVSKKEVIGKKRELFSFAELEKEIEIFLYPIFADANVLVEIDIDPTIQLYGYRDEFRQVMLNILMNSIDALKVVYRDRKIIIHAQTHDDQVIVSIQNNGPRIPTDLLQTIFEPFVTNKKLGTGIGLFVCQQIIEKHEGTIHCTSYDDFTTFSISLPTIHSLQHEKGKTTSSI